VHGTRPAGILTAGTAQYYINIMGQQPVKKCVILGSGDIGMIMARRLTLEGSKVLGVYEAKQTPGGLLRNVSQCLDDFDIPLHFGHTVTRVAGIHRLRAIELSRVDKNLVPIRGSELGVKCESLILSVGLIPENELAESIGIPLSPDTRGPICDHNNMTLFNGIFSCGNSMHVNDIVDYVSESGEIAGRNAARYAQRERRLIKLNAGKEFLYAVPQYIDVDMIGNEAVIFFRSQEERENVIVRVLVSGHEVLSQEFERVRPPEMKRIAVSLGEVLGPESSVELLMEDSIVK
ncbi:MAG: NAD(P)/FAD-dependent oxidoreductase, partial [Oscillospiraceae bacterium]|nr:NAD(P)/FAD-dependent oxidoreductase [Oscillospiraceae bacterium]